MDPDARDTLYVNGRSLVSPLNALIRQKGLLEAEVQRYNARCVEAERIQVPRRFHSRDDLLTYDPDSRFPNLIVKHSLRDMARGIALYKTDRVPAAALQHPYTAFEYVPHDVEVRREDGSTREYAVKYRVLLLVTPDGPVYLGSIKNASTTPLPATLEPGPVMDLRPYVVNGHLGATTLSGSEAEEALLEPVTLRIGRVIYKFFLRKRGVTWL